jgi:aspartyl/asparaginyl beta-hydroxylase (cupin superfamily)
MLFLSLIYKYVFVFFGSFYNQTLHFFLPKTVFFDSSQFLIIKLLESNCDKIRDEFLEIYKKEIIPQIDEIFEEQNKLNNDKKWRFFLLKSYFKDQSYNSIKAPITSRLMNDENICSAFFSVLEANSSIPKHKGPYKGIIRIHLPLVVPEKEKDCFIIVNGKKRHWQKGKCLIFDDYFEHSVTNNTDEIRVVLFIDYIRPLFFPLSKINVFLLKIIGNSIFIKRVNKKAKNQYV